MFSKIKAQACIAVAIAGWCLSGLAVAQQDGGAEAVIAAQMDSAPVQPSPYPQEVLSDWVRGKGWTEGWDSAKNRFIMVAEVGGRIRATDRNFLDKRMALYQELELRLKAMIIKSIFQEVDASVIIKVPGNPLEAQFKKLKEEYDDALAAADDALFAAIDDYEDVLAIEEVASLEALQGVTALDRWNAILDGIAKRLDESYSSADVEQAKKDRAADLKVQLDQAGQRVARAVDLKKEVEKQANAELKAVQGEFAKSQETSVKSFSAMPLLGAVMLKTAEAYDGKRDYRMAGVMAWSPQLQEEAAAMLLGTAELKPRPNKQTFDEWIASLDLSNMIGTRRYLAADGSVNFVGFAALEYDPNDVGRESRDRTMVSEMANGMTVLSMKSDVEVTRLVETKSFGVDTAEGTEDFTFKNLSEEMIQNTDGTVGVPGLILPSARRVTHAPSGRPIFVAYGYINSDAAAKSEILREETYALKRWINEDQSAKRGREAGRKAAADAAKNDPNAYAQGYQEGKAGVEATDAANRAAAAPAPEAQRPMAAPAPTATGQTQSGTFVDDTDVEDDF